MELLNNGFATKEMAIRISKKDAISFGETMSKKLKYDFSFSSLCDIIVKTINGKIIYDHSLSINNFKESGSLEIKSEKDFTIKLDPLATYARNNFTLAHELGHYYLHYMLNDNSKELVKKSSISFLRRDSNLLEWQANWFASGFLMPEKRFREEQKRHDGNNPFLSAIFEVSLEAIKYRQKYLKI